MQQQLKVSEKQRAFFIVYTSSTTHFIDVTLTKCMFKNTEDTVKIEKESEISDFPKPGFLHIQYSWTSQLNPRRVNFTWYPLGPMESQQKAPRAEGTSVLPICA